MSRWSVGSAPSESRTRLGFCWRWSLSVRELDWNQNWGSVAWADVRNVEIASVVSKVSCSISLPSIGVTDMIWIRNKQTNIVK